MNSLAAKLASGITRLTPFGKGDEDPISSVKAATRWVKSLPIGDAFKCQQSILGEIKRLNEKSTPFTKDRLAVLMLLDEKAQDLQDTLVRQYLRNPRMSRSLESQLWHAVYGLYWEAARGYYTFVQLFSTRSEKSAYESQIPLITLRAMRAFGHLLKWRSIRYLPAGEKLWLRLHNLYRIAESEGFKQQPLLAYAYDTRASTCESAYLRIAMLSLANSGTLYPKQLDQLDLWLKNWHTQLQIETRLHPDAPSFVVDLSADYGPRRARKPDLNKPMRFWTTSALLLKLDELTAALNEGQTPEELGLPEGARTAECLDLLKHLHHSWDSLSSREQRRAPRETMKRLFDVAHGLTAIVNQIKVVDATAPSNESPYGSGLSYNEVDDVQVYGFITERTRERVSQMQAPVAKSSPDVESWVMHDESECGFGAIVESRDKDWLRVGALICLKPHESNQWQLGIIRRLSRVSDDSSSVGIETLTEAPALVMLYDPPTAPVYTVDGVDQNSGSQQAHASLWLGSDDQESVIIDPVNFIPGRPFQIHGVSEIKKITLGKPLDRSEGWIHVMIQPYIEPRVKPSAQAVKG